MASTLFEKEAYAVEKLTVSSTAIPLTVAVYDVAEPIHGVGSALITVETNSIRIYTDGTTATTTDGHLFPAGSQITITNGEGIRNASLIASGADATVQVSYAR